MAPHFSIRNYSNIVNIFIQIWCQCGCYCSCVFPHSTCHGRAKCDNFISKTLSIKWSFVADSDLSSKNRRRYWNAGIDMDTWKIKRHQLEVWVCESDVWSKNKTSSCVLLTLWLEFRDSELSVFPEMKIQRVNICRTLLELVLELDD